MNRVFVHFVSGGVTTPCRNTKTSKRRPGPQGKDKKMDMDINCYGNINPEKAIILALTRKNAFFLVISLFFKILFGDKILLQINKAD